MRLQDVRKSQSSEEIKTKKVIKSVLIQKNVKVAFDLSKKKKAACVFSEEHGYIAL